MRANDSQGYRPLARAAALAALMLVAAAGCYREKEPARPAEPAPPSTTPQPVPKASAGLATTPALPGELKS